MLKYDGEKLKKSMESAMRHPFWKKMYEDAPSEECKEYLKYTYYSSDYYDPDAADAKDFIELKDSIEQRLSAGDWEYLKGMAPNSPFVGYCNQKIKELSK